MKISPDQYIIWKIGFIEINSTILFTWIVMAILIGFALILRLRLNREKTLGGLQSFFEAVIIMLENQVKDAGFKNMKFIFPVIATLFLFVLVSNMIGLIPWMKSPTASLSTTATLSLMVFIIGYAYGIYNKGFKYFKKYISPTPLMLPMNIISDISSTFSMAIRLYGNMMSGAVIGVVLTGIMFLSVGFPVLIHLLSFIAGAIQAYIFSTLAMSFIISAEEE